MVMMIMMIKQKFSSSQTCETPQTRFELKFKKLKLNLSSHTVEL